MCPPASECLVNYNILYTSLLCDLSVTLFEPIIQHKFLVTVIVDVQCTVTIHYNNV